MRFQKVSVLPEEHSATVANYKLLVYLGQLSWNVIVSYNGKQIHWMNALGSLRSAKEYAKRWLRQDVEKTAKALGLMRRHG